MEDIETLERTKGEFFEMAKVYLRAASGPRGKFIGDFNLRRLAADSALLGASPAQMGAPGQRLTLSNQHSEACDQDKTGPVKAFGAQKVRPQ